MGTDKISNVAKAAIDLKHELHLSLGTGLLSVNHHSYLLGSDRSGGKEQCP